MGKCKYILTKDSFGNKFEVIQSNEACLNGSVSCTSSITVKIAGYTIELQRGETLVNGSKVTLPQYYPGELLYI